MKSTNSANSAARARAGLQAAWAAFGVAVALHGIGAWNIDAAFDRLPPLCLFHAITGIDCPGCGMTHAFLRLAQGDVAGAWAFHPFSPLLAVLLLVLAWGPKTAWQWIQQSVVAKKIAAFALAILLGWWVSVKLLPLMI